MVNQKIDDWKLLHKRQATPVSLESFSNANRLFFDKASVNEFNNESLAKLKIPIVPLVAKNSQSDYRNAKDDDFVGLCKELFITILSQIN